MSENYNGGTILVPLKGQSTDQDVLRMAALLAKKKHAVLYAIHVVVVPQELALDASMNEEVSLAENVLDEASQVVREYGVELETGILQARSAGVAIVEEALAREVKLIIMAVTYQSRRGEFNIGRTIPYVLKNAPSRIWMFRDEVHEVEGE